MKNLYFRLSALLVASILLLPMAATAAAPNWSVNPALYAHSMNIVARARFNTVPDNSTGNRVGVFVGTELRGMADPVLENGVARFYVTVYSNQVSGEALTFKLYRATDNIIHAVAPGANFVRGAVLGTVPAPVWLSAYTGGDFPISIDTILPRLAIGGAALAPIPLTPLLRSTDNDPVVWTAQGSAHLTAAIVGTNLVITPNPLSWSGLETVSVTATETGNQSNHSAARQVTVRVMPSFTGPDFSAIGQRCAPQGGNFTTFDLDDYLTYTGSCRRYDYTLTPFTGSAAPPAWAQPGGGSGAMNIIAEVAFGNVPMGGNGSLLAAYRGATLVGVAPPQVSGNNIFYFMTAQNIGSGPLSFKYYHAAGQYLYTVPGTVPFVPGSTLGAIDGATLVQVSPLSVVVALDNTVSITVNDPAWTGSFPVGFRVEDCLFPTERSDVEQVTFSYGLFTEAVSATVSATSLNVCAGIPVTFTAATVGTNLAYAWKVNGVPAGTNSPTFTSSGLPNGAVVSCTASSSSTCASPAQATSSVTVTVKPLPVMACPPNQSVFTQAATCVQRVTIPAPVVTGECAAAGTVANSFNNTAVATDNYPRGTTVVTWTLSAGPYTATCTHTITVTDNVIPNMACLANQTYATAATVNIPRPANLTDNCGFQKLEVRRRLSTATAYTAWLPIAGGAVPTGQNPFNSAANGGTFSPATTVGTWVLQYRGWDVNNNYKVCQFNVKVNANMAMTQAELEADALTLPEPQSWEVLAGEEMPEELLLASPETVQDGQMEVAISPNPTDGMLAVAISGAAGSDVAFAVMDGTGKVLQQYAYGNINGILRTELDLAKLPNGIYFLQIQSGETVRMERVLKF